MKLLRKTQPSSPRGGGKGEDLYGQAVSLQDGGKEKEAFALFLRGAAMGDKEAMTAAGVCLMTGKGTRKDAKKAVEWWRKGVELGQVRSMFNLARALQEGDGVAEKDVEGAVELYRRAWEAGDKDAGFALARCYERGEGVTRSESSALDIYT